MVASALAVLLVAAVPNLNAQLRIAGSVASPQQASATVPAGIAGNVTLRGLPEAPPADATLHPAIASESPGVSGDTTAGIASPNNDLTATVTGPQRMVHVAAASEVSTALPVSAANSMYAVSPARPVAPLAHRFFDRKNVIGFTVHGITRAADAAQSCILLGRTGRQESWLPMRSCGAIATYSLSMVPAQIGSSYVLHRGGHHTLERWLPYLWATPSAAGIALSIKAW